MLKEQGRTLNAQLRFFPVLFARLLLWCLLTVILQSILPEESQGQVSSFNRAKLHSYYQRLIDSSASSLLKSSAFNEDRFEAIVITPDAISLRQQGYQIHSVWTEFATGKFSISELKKLTLEPKVRFIETGSQNALHLNVSRGETGTDLIHAGYINQTAYKGRGVIIVVYDSGIDWSRPDFCQSPNSSSTRILSLWDQTLEATGRENPPKSFSYGVEYSQRDIDNELDGSPAGFVRSRDYQGHGTHVAGIAAGNGAASNGRYGGIAPEADLIIIKGGEKTFSETRMIDGLKYALQKSLEYQKPVVVNWSIGGHFGPHDGTRAYELAINEFVQVPGRAVVVSAGNEGGKPIHYSGSLPTGGSSSLSLTVPTYLPSAYKFEDSFTLDLWVGAVQNLSVKVYSPSESVYESPLNALNSPDGTIDLTSFISPLNGQRNIQLVVRKMYKADPKTGTWTMVLQNTGTGTTYDAWLAASKVGTSEVKLVDGNSQMTVAMPGTAIGAITVGSHISRWEWLASDGKRYRYLGSPDLTRSISPMSSIGPTRDRRQKPELTAPGQGIASVRSGTADSAAMRTRTMPGGSYVILEGSSMAAPHVTGAAAVLLGVFPTLPAAQLKNILTHSARIDEYTGKAPNAVWGEGKLDLFSALALSFKNSSKPMRIIQSYDIQSEHGSVLLTGQTRYAVRFTPALSGMIVGMQLQILNSSIHGEGDHLLLTEVTANNSGSVAGVPGMKIGKQVSFSLSQLTAATNNLITMIGADASVKQGVDVHLVLSLSHPDDSLWIQTDQSQAGINRSSIDAGGSWKNFSDPSSGVNPQVAMNNLRLRAIIATFDAADEVFREVTKPGVTLYQNYPNPFRQSTTIRYVLPEQSFASMSIYDILGRKIRTLFERVHEAGEYINVWDGRDEQGRQVAAGVYFFRFDTPGNRCVQKLMILK